MEAGQDPRLFAAFNRVELAPLNEAEARAVELARRDFTLSGVGLDDAAKARFREIRRRAEPAEPTSSAMPCSIRDRDVERACHRRNPAIPA